MATYYVSPYGSNSNNGLGPDPNNAVNKPYATIDKVIGSTGTAAAGDTIYIAPGVYRETTTVGVSGSAGSWISIIGDPTNAMGFMDSTGSRVTPGEVKMTNYLVDTVLPTAATLVLINGKNYLSFSKMSFVGSTGGGSVDPATFSIVNGSHDIKFTSCSFMQCVGSASTHPVFAMNTAFGGNVFNLSIDRCLFFSSGGRLIQLTFGKTSSGSDDYDVNTSITNCLFLSGDVHIYLATANSGTYGGKGVVVTNCTSLVGFAAAVQIGTGSTTATIIRVYNSLFVGNSRSVFTGLSTGQIIEDYNVYTGILSFTDAGPHSSSSGANGLMLDFGQWAIWGQKPLPFLSPLKGSPILGCGSNSASGTTPYDFLGRSRPEGGRSNNISVGYLERHNSGEKETSVVDSGYSIRLTGPSSQDMYLPINSTTSAISVKCRYDSAHGTTTPPTLSIMSQPGIGIPDNYGGSGINQVITAPTTSGTWNTLTSSSLSPTANGVVKLILSNHSSSPSGLAYFDTFSVT